MKKLAIALQVCPLDVWLGLRLAKIIASIESKKRDDIEFVVSARRDTNPNAVEDIAKAVKEAFSTVRIIRGKRFGTGWPNGCNDLWAETMFRVSQMRESGKLQSSGVLTFESDCLPLRHDWLDILAEGWRKAQAAGSYCLGHAHGEPHTHINGNAIFACDVTEKFPELSGSDARTGWDAYHGKLLLRIGRDTPLIYQRYRIKTTTRDEVEGIRKGDEIPALFHGIKGTTGMEAVEDMISDRTLFSR